MENADVANGQNNILFSCHIDGRYWNVSIYLAKKEAKNQIRYLLLYLRGTVTHHQLGFKSNKCKLGLEREVDT